jgi:hypothetical protein
MFLDSLLTKKEVRVNDSWKVDNDSTCYLLGVEAVLDGGLSVYLVKNDDKSAQLEVKGTVAASVQNVATTITVDGKAQVDLGSGCVTWFAANVEETRDISERSPGWLKFKCVVLESKRFLAASLFNRLLPEHRQLKRLRSSNSNRIWAFSASWQAANG